ncbi:hypothetical protein [Streptosporangium sp. CA-115845]|uniref:hypothetical protein n=1 Tax=Streptosporangium sp. CA-115845 TaxID=3240071 RepID=UPI003D901AF2
MSRRAARPAGIGAHLIGVAVISALAWWLLSLTSLPVVAAAWLAGLVAGLAALSALRAAHRAVLASLTAQSKPAPRSRSSR